MAANWQVLEFWFDTNPVASKPATLHEAEVVNAFDCDAAAHLGSGAFAETWRIDTGATSDAVKVILDPAYPTARLDKEAEGLRRGRCDNVVALRDVGRASIGGKDRAYFRCEFVEGGDASSHLRARHWPDHAEQVAFASGVLRGLAALHEAESVHRDVKFENVALRDGDWARPVLLDLGLVRIESGSSLTTYPALMGTPSFMAPEQVRRERAKKASDLWALGIMAFVLGNRRHPFYGDRAHRLSETEALAAMDSGPPDTAGLPSPLDDLTGKWLDPAMYKRGSARTALRRFDQLGEETHD